MTQGYFITFEGGEGAGKSTQIARLGQFLVEKGYSVTQTREPGGTKLAEVIRCFILSGQAKPYGEEVETLLFATARHDHIEQLIRPALNNSHIVLCDRFVDSTRVYQGLSGTLNESFMQNLERASLNGVQPDLTIILDIDPNIGLARASKRRVGAVDRFEEESLAIHQKRRMGFLNIAKNEPNRCVVVDANRDENSIFSDIYAHVSKKLRSHFHE
jgi:dTMP kinase